MNRTHNDVQPGPRAMHSDFPDNLGLNPQTALLDAFFPGFSLLSTALYRYSRIDISVYFPTLIVLGLLTWASSYVSTWIKDFMDKHLMSTADIRIDDEMYNMVMAWVATQKFAKKSRRFVANTNLNSRMWWLFRDYGDDDDEDDISPRGFHQEKEKKLQFTPSFGTHYFWYKGRPFVFSRTQDRNQGSWGTVSERENISLSSFGRDPTLLKRLLNECRAAFSKNDENRTIIYRGGLRKGTSEPTWTRCSTRASRPFSTVVLDESVKQSLLDDMSDYLHPRTRRWYSNRGIPYRRGYLLYGPPGTGKSSLSFAIAGYFKLKIYIVSLNSPSMNEENLGSLFDELPKRCLVLLEDIDTAGLTHTRDEIQVDDAKPAEGGPGSTTTVVSNDNSSGRLSLSALLNIIDGVSSHEGRVLVMTTNHIEKLDEALIRPGRVDMTVKFDLADTDIIITIFRAIFATLDDDIPKPAKSNEANNRSAKKTAGLSEATKEEVRRMEDEEEEAKALEVKRLAEEARITELGKRFAELVPAKTFSPAEIQGYLLKNKREPEMAIKNAEVWVKNTLMDKRKKAQEEREKEAKEKEDREKAKEEKLEKGKEKEEEKET